jgi:hypothetical protein
MEPIYHAWLGLPHEIGADPRNGQGACCLVMAKILLEDAGRSAPPIEDWIVMAKASDWGPLRDAFYRHTEELSKPEPFALTLLENGSDGLGLGTVIPNSLLLVPLHKRGVTTIPLYAMPVYTTYHRVISYD